MIPTLIGGVASQPVFNDATGGTITTVTDYNGTGQTWRVHSFTSSGTFTVTRSNFPYKVLVVGGGGGGGNNNQSATNGGGGAGGYLYDASSTISINSYSVTVGSGGAEEVTVVVLLLMALLLLVAVRAVVIPIRTMRTLIGVAVTGRQVAVVAVKITLGVLVVLALPVKATTAVLELMVVQVAAVALVVRVLMALTVTTRWGAVRV